MKDHEMTAFARLWSGMAEMYGKTASDAVIGMSFGALAKYDLLDIRRAINAHVADPMRGQFMAKPADLILHIDGDPESRSLSAWTKVENAIGQVGPYPSVVFDDASIMTCIEDMGGWIAMCNISSEEMPFKRQEFTKRYKGFLFRPPVFHPAKLIGLSDSHNMQHAPEFVATPVLIGNPDQAALVNQSGGQKSGKVISLADHLSKLSLTKDMN